MTVRNKAQLLAFFHDNTAGDIDATHMRDFVDSIYDQVDNSAQAGPPVNITALPPAVLPSQRIVIFPVTTSGLPNLAWGLPAEWVDAGDSILMISDGAGTVTYRRIVGSQDGGLFNE